ncbi:MAG TPA: outer membrane beta-barrel protein [Hyphomicrobiaceae bacterium]|nr:outer membrane beta-barrel protein [Hyphomicrobiaceae bacterium]
MKKVFTALIAATALFGSVATASAGGSIKDEPMGRECGPGPFSGAYFGVHGGWVRADSEQTGTDSFGNVTKTSTDADGWTIGVLSGYGWQCGRTYFGIESDINWMDVDQSLTIIGTGTLGTPFSQSLRTSYDYFSTMRGRIGIVHDTALFYLTGGLAMASVEHRFESTTPTIAFSQSNSDTRWGWTVGGGVELSRGHWTLRGEVLYVDLGEESYRYQVVSGCTTCDTTIKWKDDFVVARVGLTFKLHREEQPYEPLK